MNILRVLMLRCSSQRNSIILGQFKTLIISSLFEVLHFAFWIMTGQSVNGMYLWIFIIHFRDILIPFCKIERPHLYPQPHPWTVLLVLISSNIFNRFTITLNTHFEYRIATDCFEFGIFTVKSITNGRVSFCLIPTSFCSYAIYNLESIFLN